MAAKSILLLYIPAYIIFKPFSVQELIIETCSVVLTFEPLSGDIEIIRCDHFNETSLAVLLHGTICFSISLQSEI